MKRFLIILIVFSVLTICIPVLVCAADNIQEKKDTNSQLNTIFSDACISLQGEIIIDLFNDSI